VTLTTRCFCGSSGDFQLGLFIKFLLPLFKLLGAVTEHKAPIPQGHGPEIAHTLAGGGGQEDRVLDFWRDPHAAARAMLLGKWFHSPMKPQLHRHAQLLMSLRLEEGFKQLPASTSGAAGWARESFPPS
jgi:hypothetical protein